MGAIVRFGGIDFFGDRFRGLGWHIGPDGFTGWNDGPGTRRDRIDRPAQHGEFTTPAFARGRNVELRGFVVATSEEKLGWEQERFQGLFGRGELVFTVEEFGRTLWARARVEDVPEFNASGFTPEAEYRLVARCVDPRKYGVERAFPPTAAYHYGNFPASPVIEVSGWNAAGGYTITGPGGRTFVVSQSLYGGDTHRIDMRTGSLYIGATRQVGAVSRADLWTISPGERAAHSLVPASSEANLSMRILVTDTYI